MFFSVVVLGTSSVMKGPMLSSIIVLGCICSVLCLKKPGFVLLGGGTGFIGSAFHRLLKSKGYEVTVISRMPGPQRVNWGDIQGKGLPKGVTAVVNLAGQNVLNPMARWTPGFKQNVWNSRVESTRTLAQAIMAADTKPKVFITISGVGIYRPSDKVVYTEDSDVGECFDYLSKLAQAWEKAAALPWETEVRRVTLRSGVVLGRTGGMIKQMFFPFFFGVGGPIASGNQFLPWIHVHDLCRLLLFAIENDYVQGVLNAVAPQVVTNQEFTTAFAKAMNRPAFFRIPEFVLNIIFGAERAKIMTEGQKVIPKRVTEYQFEYSFPSIDAACQEVAQLFYTAKEPIKC